MARIRSIHPGFWTDETLASLSDAAALFYIGLLNEADDNGVFEWKPLTLRMRLRPSKDGDVEALLAELSLRNVIRRYEVAGRAYGAVRNFCRYQKPKFPKSVHPVTDAVRQYVRSARPIPEGGSDDGGLFPPPAEAGTDDGPAVPPNAETAAQREEGAEMEAGAEGEKMLRRRPRAPGGAAVLRGGSDAGPRATPEAAAGPAPPAPAAADDPSAAALEAECRAAAGLTGAGEPLLADLSPILTLIAEGYDVVRDVLPKLRAARAAGKRGRTWAYYVPAIVEGRAANARIPAWSVPLPLTPLAWVLHDGPAWTRHAARYRATHGRDPPRVAGLGGMGWHFPREAEGEATTGS